MRDPKSPDGAKGAIPLLLDPAELLGVCSLLPGLLPPPPVLAPPPVRPLALLLIAPNADSAWETPNPAWPASALEDELREIAKPLTSLSDSSVGSRETNSFCSN